MVDIDYYSKYLKYKQKYLKQKNLQIGGESFFLNIILINNKDKDKKPITYQHQELNLDETIEKVIKDWFVTINIIPKGELIVTKDNSVLNKSSTFRVYKDTIALNNNSFINVYYG